MRKPKAVFKSIWRLINQRCNDHASPSYNRYGARGIKLGWGNYQEFERDMYSLFVEHYYRNKGNTSIDRKDSSLGYIKENCRWVTKERQQQNKLSIRWVTINGVSKNVKEWSKIYGIKNGTVCARIMNGWEEKKAIVTPIRDHKKIKNKIKPRKGYAKGYYFSVKHGRWIANVSIAGKTFYLGVHNTEKDASEHFQKITKKLIHYIKHIR